MSYYGAKGDFYSGHTGYYRGDPGFFSSLGSIFKKVVPVAASFIPGVGGIAASALGGLMGGGGGSPPPQPTISAAGSAGLGLMGARGTSVGMRTAGKRGGGRLSAAAATLPGMIARVGAAAVPGRTFGAPAGARMRTGRRHRMNVCNPRALRRAIRRAKGFEKLALRSIRLVNPHRLRGKHRGGFRVARRKR